MIPKFVRSVAEFNLTVQFKATPESQVLEFKSDIDNWNLPKGAPDDLKREAQKEACRDVAQFANTVGGCLLIGVTEKRLTTGGLPMADDVQPVTSVGPLLQWLEQAIGNFLVPSTITHDIVAIPLAKGTVIAVNIPPSIHLVSLWDDGSHTIEYWYRTSHGKRSMNPEEAERHLMNASRAAKLKVMATVDSVPAHTDVEIAGGFWARFPPGQGSDQRWRPPGPLRIQAHEDGFVLFVPTGRPTISGLMIPYGLAAEVWLGVDRKINLLLSVKLLIDAHTGLVSMEPYA